MKIPPVSSSPFLQRFWLVGLLLLLSAVAAGLWLPYYQSARRLHQITQALREGNLFLAGQLLESTLRRDPENPRLLQLEAQWLALCQHPRAASAWQQVVRISPTPANRLAAVMSLLQAGRSAEADVFLRSWPQEQRENVYWHQAAQAVAFARGNLAEAERHTLALLAQHPQDNLQRLNLARLAPGKPENEAFLWAAAEEPVLASEALRLLARTYSERRRKEDLQRVLAAVEKLSAPTPGDYLWPLEAAEQAGLPIGEAQIRKAWDALLPLPPFRTQLFGWMNATGRSALIWQWLPLDRDHRWHWQSPSGFALAEAALLSRQPEIIRTAREQLLDQNWPDRHRQSLCLARLYGEGEASALWLRRAQQAAAQPAQLAELLQICRTWGWLEGEYFLTLPAIEQGAIAHPKELAPLLRELESCGATERLHAVNLALAAKHPETALWWNNAAYYGMLLNLPEAASAARTAHRLEPDNPEYAGTLALCLAAEARWEEMKTVLLPFSNHPAAHQACYLYSKAIKDYTQVELLKKLLNCDQLRLPEEKKLFDCNK